MEPLGTADGVLLAGVSSFDVGGMNAHVLLSSHSPGGFDLSREKRQDQVAFISSGQGSQFLGMGKDLYVKNREFRECLQQCNALLLKKGWLNRLILDILYSLTEDDSSQALIEETMYLQPVLFSFEWSLAQVFMSEGILPKVVIGHSLGELVAACIAGVFSLKDGLMLAARRGEAMQACQDVKGAMFALNASRAEVEARICTVGLSDGLAVPASNSNRYCAVSGSLPVVMTFVKE